MSSTTTFSMRVPATLLERIDQSAAHHGQTRTNYVLSWLPEAHDRDTEQAQTSSNGNARQSRRDNEASPTRLT